MFRLLCALLFAAVYLITGTLIDLVFQGQMPAFIPLFENSSGMDGILAGFAMMPEIVVMLAMFGTTSADQNSSSEEGLLLDQLLFDMLSRSKKSLVLLSSVLAALLSCLVYLVWSTLSTSKELDARNCVCLIITFVAVISVFVVIAEGTKRLEEITRNVKKV